jgi:hypothetical protein
MASELREVWRVIGYGFDDVFMDQESAERMQFVGVDEAVIERLPLLTPEAKAVLDRACKLQDMADAIGVDMEDDLFAASWGLFSRTVVAYQETRGSDAN